MHPADLAAVAGVFAGLAPADGTRYQLGWDVAGIVDAVGDGVTSFTPGDAVVGLSFWITGLNGVQADYAVLDAGAIARAPLGVSPAEAATLPLNGLTAAFALDLLNLPAGASVAITGAAGGVGGFAIQLAAASGLRVVAVAAADDEQLVRDLGANEFVARTDRLADAVRAVVPDGVDGVFDPALVGNGALSAVRDAGVYVFGAPQAPEPERGIRTDGVQVRVDGQRLATLARLVEDGRLRLRIAETYPLTQAAAAYKRLAGGGVRGGVVLLP